MAVAGISIFFRDEIGKLGIPVLRDGVTALQDMALAVRTASGKIRIRQQAKGRIGFEMLVNPGPLPIPLCLGAAVPESDRIAGVEGIRILVLHVIKQQACRFVADCEAKFCEQFQLFIIVQVSVGYRVKAVAEKVIVITEE